MVQCSQPPALPRIVWFEAAKPIWSLSLMFLEQEERYFCFRALPFGSPSLIFEHKQRETTTVLGSHAHLVSTEAGPPGSFSIRACLVFNAGDCQEKSSKTATAKPLGLHLAMREAQDPRCQALPSLCSRRSSRSKSTDEPRQPRSEQSDSHRKVEASAP